MIGNFCAKLMGVCSVRCLGLLGLMLPIGVVCGPKSKIDRVALVRRNSPQVVAFDTLSALSVGNGRFAMTVDATGLQSFPQMYKNGIPLGTQSEWGWHSNPNIEGFSHDETLVPYRFRDRDELYSIQPKEPLRAKQAADYFRENPHRLHLGYLGLRFFDGQRQTIAQDRIGNIRQTLDLWAGSIDSRYTVDGANVAVSTVCHPDRDMVAAHIESSLIDSQRLEITLRFPFPTVGHADDASNWGAESRHVSEVMARTDRSVLVKRTLDGTVYFVALSWEGKAKFDIEGQHGFVLRPLSGPIDLTCRFSEAMPDVRQALTYKAVSKASLDYWSRFWREGGAVDFSACLDPRAKEMERRVVLSQYLLAIQSSGTIPPQETGLTYNSWYGRPHLEMHWWHSAQFALWGRSELLERSLGWYKDVAFPVAKEIAQRQGFDGIRWMKMTDRGAGEAPSKVGSFLIWQQPHFIYLAELAYRSSGDRGLLERYKEQVFETANFMASFVTYDQANDRYVIKGAIPAQETLRASETVNPPFELSYWHFALQTAQLWRQRLGLAREPRWDEVVQKLSPLASANGLYLAAETALDTYSDIRFTSDHPAVLGAVGMLPQNRLVDTAVMKATLRWIWGNWQWERTWGWDFPLVAMCAARLGERQMAVDALLMDKRTNTYLPNGHNCRDARLRAYLPGNGGLLAAVAMMCAGWDGASGPNPGFPANGMWNVKWEGLKPLP